MHFIRKKKDDSPLIVHPSVEEVGWNDVYVLYKRIDFIIGKTEYGVLNTEKDTNEILDINGDFQKQLKDHELGSIQMFDVDELVENKRHKRGGE